MSKKLYIPNPYRANEWTKIESYANKTNNQNIIFYYKNLMQTQNEKEYEILKECLPLGDCYYYNKVVFLLEDEKISSAAFIEGYNDEKKCYITFSSLEDKQSSIKTLLYLITTYAKEKLRAENIGITIKTNDNELLEFAINNNYDIIDKGKEKTKLIRQVS